MFAWILSSLDGGTTIIYLFSAPNWLPVSAKLRRQRQLVVEIWRRILPCEAAKHSVNWLIKDIQCWTMWLGSYFPAALSPLVQMKSAQNNPFVSSSLSRRGNCTSLLPVQKHQQRSPAAQRSLRPLNDRQQSCQIRSFGFVELISRFRAVCCKFSSSNSWLCLSSFYNSKWFLATKEKGKKSHLIKFHIPLFYLKQLY